MYKLQSVAGILRNAVLFIICRSIECTFSYVCGIESAGAGDVEINRLLYDLCCVCTIGNTNNFDIAVRSKVIGVTIEFNRIIAGPSTILANLQGRIFVKTANLCDIAVSVNNEGNAVCVAIDCDNLTVREVQRDVRISIQDISVNGGAFESRHAD